MKRSKQSATFTGVTAGLFAAAVSVGAATPPIPDFAYGGHGDGIARIAVTEVPADNGSARHAVAQADGSLVVVGTASSASGAEVVLARFDAQGLPDSTFGPQHDGFYRPAFAGSGNDITQTSDGKLIYAGHNSSVDAVILGRLHADGTPDTDFFDNGQRVIAAPQLMGGAIQAEIMAVLPLPDGKMLAIGWAAGPNFQYWSCAMRLLADGSDDASFGGTGRVCIAPAFSAGSYSFAMAGCVLADGRIRLAGYSKHSSNFDEDMSVAALRGSDGAFDTSFGPDHDGWAFVSFNVGGGRNDEAHAIAIDDEGRILLAGSFEGVNGDADIGVVRLMPDGSPDTAFGSQGRVEVALDLGASDYDNAHSIAVLPYDRILVGGAAYTDDSHPVGAAILLETNGALDPHFGTGGIFLQADPTAPATGKLQSQQQFFTGEFIYMVGAAFNANNHSDFAAMRAVIPLFADGFESFNAAAFAQP